MSGRPPRSDACRRTAPASVRAGTGGAPDRAGNVHELLRECRLCPRACGAARLEGETGFCGAGADARVAAVSIHHGEEPPISGSRGSGTVFLSHCNMACVFCQNYPISQFGVGTTMSVEELADKILGLQRRGAHNVNFVTPTPHIPHLIEAIRRARVKGLFIPVVYNTNGYETVEMLGLLDGIVDIYLPDMKYRSDDLADLASRTPDYALHNGRAVAEMVRQAGPLDIGGDGIARRGVLIRHLVLPGRVDETEKVLAHVREVYGPAMPVSLMGQYFPAFRAGSFQEAGKAGAGFRGAAPPPRFRRKLSAREYGRAIDLAIAMGLENVYIQDDLGNTAVTV